MAALPRPQLAERLRWARAWQRAGLGSAPPSTVAGCWPTCSYTFRCPPGWNTSDLSRASERVAIASGSHWWELQPSSDGRWMLLIDASDWRHLRGVQLRPTVGDLTVPIGRYPEGVASWDLRLSPHLLVAGATGSGKSSFLRALVACLPLGWCWRVIIIDPKQLDFAPASDVLEVVELRDASAVMAGLVEELNHRKSALKSASRDHWTDLPTRVVPTRPTLLVIDEAADVLGGVGVRRTDTQQLRDDFGTLARQGRACGIHLVASFTRPDADVIPGAMRDQFGARVGLGPLSPDGARMVFGGAQLPTLPDALPGTGLALGLDGRQRVHRFGVPFYTLDDVVCRHSARS